MTKVRRLSYLETVNIHHYLIDNKEALKGKTMEEIAQIAGAATGLPATRAHVTRINKLFVLGLGARKKQKKEITLTDIDTLRAVHKRDMREMLTAISIVSSGLESLYEKLGEPAPAALKHLK